MAKTNHADVEALFGLAIPGSLLLEMEAPCGEGCCGFILQRPGADDVEAFLQVHEEFFVDLRAFPQVSVFTDADDWQDDGVPKATFTLK